MTHYMKNDVVKVGMNCPFCNYSGVDVSELYGKRCANHLCHAEVVEHNAPSVLREKEKQRDEKLSVVITKLKSLGAKVKHRRRKLAHSEKDYLTLIGVGGHSEYTSVILPALRSYFPDAYMTSGSFASETCNSVPGGWEPRFNFGP
jgi:hypothetical protein